MNRNQNGFTLVELLAVIVVLAIVLIIAVPGVLSIINKTKNPKPGLLLFVEKSMPESCFKFINNFLVIKLFVGKKIKIDRTAMAISQRQSGSANK